MSSFEERLVRAVKAKREAQGLSIRALSEEVGVSFSTLARIERGDGQPDNNSKVRLLQWLGADADDAKLGFDNVAFVHFRAGKNVRSSTIRNLLRAAEALRHSLGRQEHAPSEPKAEAASPGSVSLSKEELEQAAAEFRNDLQLSPSEPLDSLGLDVEGVQVISIGQTDLLDVRTVRLLREQAAGEWSAMSVPLDIENENWVILLNDGHRIERQRVTVLEEYWHILLGHKLTRIARVADAYGRSYDRTEEHDAYYLASATLLPKAAVVSAVLQHESSEQIALRFGTSAELVDYRIKRLGLWRQHAGKQVKLTRG